MDRRSSDEGAILAAALASAWGSVERILSGSLSSIRGIAYSEYRLLAAIAAGPNGGSSRADLARSVGLSPSAVTRALRPLEALGVVATAKHERDARLAIARLTPEGEQVVSDAAGVVNDVMAEIADKTNLGRQTRNEVLEVLREFARL